jgi:hypothetical protein
VRAHTSPTTLPALAVTNEVEIPAPDDPYD